MNIVCFTGAGATGIALVNQIHEVSGVALHVVEQPASFRRVVLRKYRSRGLSGVVDAALARSSDRRRHIDYEATYDQWFGETWRTESPVRRLVVPSINHPEVVEALQRLGDVVLVVEASSIVRERVLETCDRTLNIHWGLSPYYRGTRCTEWALLHWDVNNIGATVHELSMVIDGGAIVGQRRATIVPEDSAFSINVQLTALGIQVVVEAVQLLLSGREYARVAQDLSEGYATYSRHWSAHLSRHVRRLERRGLAELVAAPARGALPIIELGAAQVP